MATGFPKGGGTRPRLLDLIPKGEEWMPTGVGRRGNGYEDETKLELRLAPPGHEDWATVKQKREEDSSALTLSLFHNKSSKNTNNSSAGEKRGGFPRMPSLKPAPPVASPKPCATATHMTRTSTTASVVGWPPIRSFRKNIASSSSAKPSSGNNPTNQEISKKTEIMTISSSSCTSMFVKINMDGIPFGRKVDLKTHDSYSKLSSAVDDLFRDLFAAQTEEEKNAGEKPGVGEIAGLLDGSGEFTLVYEDIEGDRMLVGDVPWNMFISTVKRLRVQKKSELSPAIALRGTCANRKHRSAPPVL